MTHDPIPDDARENRLETLFARAVEASPEARAALIEETRREDPGLAAELTRLVRAHEATPSDFLDRFDASGAAELLRPDDPTEIGPYRVHGRVASGGMGEVYLAEDPRLERRVAIKLLPPWSVGDEKARRRLYREARVAAALDHPNIQAVYEVGETDDGEPYLAMAYYRGETLRSRLRRGPLTIDETLDVATQIAQGLSVAHEAGILHRDLKPENVILTPGGVVKIIDFGISKRTSGGVTVDPTLTEGTPGTVAYMAPEQLDGDPRPASDVWSVGVILYEMLSGQRPFPADSARAAAAAILGMDPAPVSRHRPEIPAALARAVARCLEKDPERRHPTAKALLGDLASVRPGAVGAPDDAARTAGAAAGAGRRARWVAGAVGAIAIVALIALFALTGAGDRRVPEAASSIAVLPLTPVPPDSALERLGQELAVLVSAGLDGVGEIRTVDALSVLARSGDDAGAGPDARAGLASSLGAASLIDGTLVRVADGVRVEARLVETRGGAPIARTAVEGSPEDVRALADSLSLSLLREIWRRGDVPVPSAGAIRTRSVPALRAYLNGERALARSEFDLAVEEFERAFAEDSTFWYAYWRSLYPRVYEGSRPDPELLDRLVDHVSGFPEPDRMLFESGRAETLSEEMDGLRRLTERFPHYWPGWYALGDRRIHWTPYVGGELADARPALERVVELNPGFASALRHLSWIDLFDRDTAAARARMERLATYSTPGGIQINPGEIRYYDVVVDLTTLGDRFTQEMLDEQAPFVASTAGPTTPYEFATGLLDMNLPRSQVQLGEAVLALSPPAETEVAQRLGVGLGLAARGAWDSALVSLDRWVEGTGTAVIAETPDAALVAYGLATAAALLGEIDPAESLERRPAAAALVRDGTADGRAELAWLDGVLAFAAGDSAALEGARGRLSEVNATWSELLERSLTAYRTALAGDRAGAGRDLAALELESAEVLRHHLTARRHPFLTSLHRLSAAPWLVAAGDTATAERLLTFSEAIYWNAQRFLDPVNRTLHTYALLGRARIADARGLRDEAAELYRRFVERYDLGRSVLQEEALGALRRPGGEPPN